MQYKTFAEKEADNGEKIFKDFNNFINMKIKTLFKTIFCAGLVLTLVLYLTDYLFFEGDYLPVGYAKAALLFTFVFPIIGTLIWRKELNNDIRTM